MQRQPAPSTPPAAPPARGLASTPAADLTPIPPDVRREFHRLWRANDHLGALMVIVRRMEAMGEIDQSILASPTAVQSGAAVCQSAVLWDVDPAMGRSAVETPCSCDPDQKPNVRIRAGTGALADIEHLHSALFHEFRHARQEAERCRLGASPGARFGGACTDCNNPDEMDSYLAEAEAGYDLRAIRRAWVRIFTNWTWLAPEQQRVFMTRMLAVQRRIEFHFPGVDWAADPQVQLYTNFCNQMDQAAGGNTAGTCDSVLAPLTAGGSRPGLPIPPPQPVGDFPAPPEDRRIA